MAVVTVDGNRHRKGGLMVQTRRERQRQATCEEIKGIARAQMAQGGAASLSLRAIAAQMGVTAPALYRYFADRDALITALIVDAFDALGEALWAARHDCPPDDWAGQFAAAMGAYRAWALAHREDFLLIYGTPIPGYEAPGEITSPAARRSNAALLDLLGAAWRAGGLILPTEYADTPPRVGAHLAAIIEQTFDHEVPVAVLRSGVMAWAHLHGLVMLELTNHSQPIIGDPGELYAGEVRALLARLGMRRAT